MPFSKASRIFKARVMRAPSLDDPLTNSQISELLANAGEDAKPPLSKAYRRASRRVLLWQEEASLLYQAGRSLTELAGVGPYLEKIIGKWMESSPLVPLPADIRENFLTRTQVRGILQKQPFWASLAKGDLQMHTLWSDGSASVQEMADTAETRGYEYIAITDHSKGLKIAGGINEEQLCQQAREIAAVNESLFAAGKTVRVLRSIEVNLNPAGAVDMEASSLRELDIVLGCFHSSLRKKDDQTDRYVAALRNPAIQILGHPRGRIYNFRLGLSADWARVLAVAAELDKAVEIDSYPDRQDMSIDLIRLARKAGCRISIGTDSHGPSQLEFIEFGLAAALKAKIDPERILNFMSREKLMEWAAGQRDRDSGRAAS
jgi:histidinol phosphatase-like PHP family hydrolase